ncbi:hypothetical protein [Acuticoccus sp. I52.16.1]|uniref:hypothetical protein n=1 Tax=Acuticoccus sp. I52.16.1 TaxID=2928472 RepID=UPI001FD5E5F1|nr:hypothetical protein [Acuticoccus sp. I52.16.1]UOM35174.1 hypothetical protein MRB58_02890 [Acuticoccus sp. I52.16.1]
MSGAYRCPVCGIDFPTGTPNTPTTPDSPAAVDPGRRTRPRPVAPGDIASRLEGALGDELFEPAPPPPPENAAERDAPHAPAATDAAEDDSEVWIDVGVGAEDRRTADLGATRPGTERAGGRGRVQWADETEPGDGDAPDPEADEDGEDAEDTGDEAPQRTGPQDAPSDFDVAAIVPGHSRASGREAGTGLSVAPAGAPKRPRRVVVAEPRTREILVVPRRRSVSKGLFGTVVVALVALVGIGGAAVYLEQSGLADFGLFQRTASGLMGRDAITVTADDGWVSIPAESGTVLIDADGTYRIRLDGEVFTGNAAQRVRVPMTTDTSLAVRTVRAPTQATVSRVP